MLTYLNDTCPGHSGSPVWVRRHPSMGGRVLVGVHSGAAPRPREPRRAPHAGDPAVDRDAHPLTAAVRAALPAARRDLAALVAYPTS